MVIGRDPVHDASRKVGLVSFDLRLRKEKRTKEEDGLEIDN